VDLHVLSIEQEPRKGERRAAKGRVFSSRLMGYLAADPLWDGGSVLGVVRPVFVAYLGTERELQPFTANLRASAKAKTGRVVLQLPKKARYRWLVQKHPQGLVSTVAYLPSLFHLDPPAAADLLCFVSAPPRWWVEAQAIHLQRELGEEAHEAARAAHFCAFLDRRSTLPLLHDLRFHLHLYRAARSASWVRSLSPAPLGAFASFGLDTCGLDEPLACCVPPDELDQFIADQTAAYFDQEIRHGSPRLAANRRLLSLPASPALQLCLDLDVA
jgi:hypothetical protein